MLDPVKTPVESVPLELSDAKQLMYLAGAEAAGILPAPWSSHSTKTVAGLVTELSNQITVLSDRLTQAESTGIKATDTLIKQTNVRIEREGSQAQIEADQADVQMYIKKLFRYIFICPHNRISFFVDFRFLIGYI